jgi:hypothetical protein
MERASMLAGEPVGDDPHSVCPVIAGVLRGYIVDRVDPSGVGLACRSRRAEILSEIA